MAAVALFLMLPEARRRPPLKVLLVGVAYASTMMLFVLSNKLTTSASAIFLQSTAPLHVLLLSPWLLGERVRRADLAYMGVLALGLASFFVGLDPVSATAPNPWLGNVLATLSGVTWALTVMGLRALGRGGSDWGPASALWGNVIACLICLPLALPVESSRPADWLVIAYLGVFQIAVAYVFLIRGLRQVPALEASLLLLRAGAQPDLGLAGARRAPRRLVDRRGAADSRGNAREERVGCAKTGKDVKDQKDEKDLKDKAPGGGPLGPFPAYLAARTSPLSAGRSSGTTGSSARAAASLASWP